MAATSSSSAMDTSSTDALNRLRAYESSVCRIVVLDSKGGYLDCGTGFLIGPNLVMACNHVIPDIATAEKCEFQFFKQNPSEDRSTGGRRSLPSYDYVKFDILPPIDLDTDLR